MTLDDDIEHGRRAVAEVRREVWPEYGGDWPEEPTQNEINEYIELLEAAVAGRTAAMHMIGRSLR